MERRDYILLQIEQMSKALAKILAKFFGIPKQDKTSETIQETSTSLKNEFGFDLEHMLKLDKDDILPYFQKLYFTFEHMEKIARYTKEIADIYKIKDPEKALDIYKKTMDLINVIRESTDSISFDHVNLHAEVDSAIKELLQIS